MSDFSALSPEITAGAIETVARLMWEYSAHHRPPGGVSWKEFCDDPAHKDRRSELVSYAEAAAHAGLIDGIRLFGKQ